MGSTYLMMGLSAVNVLVAVLSLIEVNYPRALYWTGAACINIAVLWSTR